MSYRTSGEFGESTQTGSIGAGGGIGGQKGADFSGGKDVTKAVEAAKAAKIAEQYNIPDVKQDEGILGLFKDIAFNQFASFVTGSIPGMLARLAFNKGPFTKESLVTGDFADLTNAPADYKSAVQDIMGGTFSAEQQAQIDAGEAARQAEREATRGPKNPLGDISPTTPMNPFEGDPIKTQRYQDFMIAGYPPDMAEYLVNVLM